MKPTWLSFAVLLAGLLTTHALAAPGTKRNFLVFVGTYTSGSSKGIYAWRFDAASGQIASLGLAAETASPSFLAVHPNGRFVYAVNEISNFEGKHEGSVTAFSLDPATGKLTELNRASSRGAGPCHLALDKTGKMLLVANYGSGNVASYPIGADGKIGASTGFDQHAGTGGDPKRQDGPHAHCTVISPDNRYAFVADLGLDKIFCYHIQPAHASMQANQPAFTQVTAGSGPRHLAFTPNGRYAYVINEMGNTVKAFQYQAKGGVLKEVQTVPTVPRDFKGQNTTAEVAVHPNGKFVYGSNRGDDSIVSFSIGGGGKLKFVERVSSGGDMPRSFAIDPTGRYLFAANQKSANVIMFSVNPVDGTLKQTGKPLDIDSPVSVLFVPEK